MHYKYSDRTDEIIKQEMLDETDDKVSKIAGTFINDSYGPSSIKLAELYMELDYLDKKRDANNLTGKELDMYVEQKAGKRVVRRKATYAKGIILFIGDDDTFIPEGTLIAIYDNTYKTIGEHIVKDGSVEVTIESLVSGSIGNVSEDATASLVNGINGIHELVLNNDISGGYNEESDESLLERYFNFIQSPPTSGNIYHYKHWAKEVEGVGDVKVVPLWNGKNTVKIVITDINMETASDELINKVQEHIDPNSSGLGLGEAPIGAYCTVTSAIGKDIKVNVSLDLEVGFHIEDIKQEVFDNINSYFRELTFNNSEVSYAKVGAAILFTNGVKDYKELKINGGKSNILLDDEEVAVLKEVIINE